MPSTAIAGPVNPREVIELPVTAWIDIERIWAGRVRVKPRPGGMQSAVRCIPIPTMPQGGRPIAPVFTSISETVLLDAPVLVHSPSMEAPGPLAEVAGAA